MDQRNESSRYPSNAITDKNSRGVKSEKQITSVVKKSAKTKTKSFGEKLSDIFFASDFQTAMKSILLEVLIPDTKGTISEMLKGTIDVMLFGDRRGGRTRSGGKAPNYSYTSYNQYYQDRNRNRDSRLEQPRPALRTVVEDLVFDSREDAEEVLDSLHDLLGQYGAVSVRDFYGLAGMSSDYTKEKYGWFSLEGACTMRTREGWLLDLPRPVVID